MGSSDHNRSAAVDGRKRLPRNRRVASIPWGKRIKVPLYSVCRLDGQSTKPRPIAPSNRSGLLGLSWVGEFVVPIWSWLVQALLGSIGTELDIQILLYTTSLPGGECLGYTQPVKTPQLEVISRIAHCRAVQITLYFVEVISRIAHCVAIQARLRPISTARQGPDVAKVEQG